MVKYKFSQLEAQSVRALGLRDATDLEIFKQARNAGAIIMTKDNDFIKLLELHGPPPKVIWITCGNTSNAQMCQILETTILQALNLLKFKEIFVEISNR